MSDVYSHPYPASTSDWPLATVIMSALDCERLSLRAASYINDSNDTRPMAVA
jgi:hypothetical protein